LGVCVGALTPHFASIAEDRAFSFVMVAGRSNREIRAWIWAARLDLPAAEAFDSAAWSFGRPAVILPSTFWMRVKTLVDRLHENRAIRFARAPDPATWAAGAAVVDVTSVVTAAAPATPADVSESAPTTTAAPAHFITAILLGPIILLPPAQAGTSDTTNEHARH
jgi:hypothetical protein